MAAFVLLILFYCFIDWYTPARPGTAIVPIAPAAPDEECPIAVEWELLPDVDEAAQGH
jgi:hypothetical protein